MQKKWKLNNLIQRSIVEMIFKLDEKHTRRELEETVRQGYSNTSEMRLNVLRDFELGQSMRQN